MLFICIFVYIYNLKPETWNQISNICQKSSNTSGVKKCGKGCEYSSNFTNFGWTRIGQNRKSGDARFSCNHATRKFVWLVRGWFGLDIFIYQNGNYYRLYHNLTISPFPAHLPPPPPSPQERRTYNFADFPQRICEFVPDRLGFSRRPSSARFPLKLLKTTLLSARPDTAQDTV